MVSVDQDRDRWECSTPMNGWVEENCEEMMNGQQFDSESQPYVVCRVSVVTYQHMRFSSFLACVDSIPS